MIPHIDQRPAHINMLYQPQRILSDVRKFMGEEDIVISDVGAHKMWIAREYNCYKPNTCIISNGFATMGIAVPGAVAAKLVYPERKILWRMLSARMSPAL